MYEYPFGNGQQLNLDWFLNEWKNLLAAWEAEKNGIEGALQAEIDRAEAALADVFAARDAAAQSAANALESKNAAAQSAEDASGYLATVHADANTAHNAAQNASQSESNAAESAQTALASKNTAANSERNAAQSEANANSSKNAAAQSAADALAHKDAAAQSAADALANKDAAAQSAEDASDAAASVEASAQQITTNTSDISNLKESLINTRVPITKEYSLINAWVQSDGKINPSETSRTGLVKLKAGESIIIGTRNKNVTVIAFTTAESITPGDTVTPIYKTTNIDEFEKFIYTAKEDINIVFCYRESEYILSFARLIYDIIAPSIGDMRTPTRLDVNDFRIVENTLYRITAMISGQTLLIPNTNCIATTITDVIKQFLN